MQVYLAGAHKRVLNGWDETERAGTPEPSRAGPHSGDLSNTN